MLWNKFLAFYFAQFVGLKELRKHLAAENEKNMRSQTHESIRAIDFNGTKMMKKKRKKSLTGIFLFIARKRLKSQTQQGIIGTEKKVNCSGNNKRLERTIVQKSIHGSSSFTVLMSDCPIWETLQTKEKAIGTKRILLHRWVTMYNRLIVTNWRLKSVGLVQNDLTSSGASLVCKVDFRLVFSCIHNFSVPHWREAANKKKRFFSITMANECETRQKKNNSWSENKLWCKKLDSRFNFLSIFVGFFFSFLLSTFSGSKIPSH